MHLNEAFRALNALDEDTFSFSDDGIEKLSAFKDNDEEDDTISVIDPEAETAEDTADSYVGKVIIDCAVCHSKIYKDKEEVKVDGEMANTDEECPYCYSTEGFKVIGEVQPFGGSSADEDDEPSKDVDDTDSDSSDHNTEDEAVEEDLLVRGPDGKLTTSQDNNWGTCKEWEYNESISSLKSNPVNEDINNLSLDTDDTHLELTAEENGRVTVSTEPVQAAEAGDEVIAPVTDETQAEIEMNGEEIPGEEDAMDDIEIDDFDEESFDGMEESYLRESYDNVKSYKTTSVEQRGQKLFIEGVITFDNGSQKKTNIVLEATTYTKSGKYSFLLESKAHRPSHKNFNITGTLNNGKFITESASIKSNTWR